MKILLATFCFGLLLVNTASAQIRVDRDIAGLKGPVKTVRVEMSDILQRDGQAQEGPRYNISLTTYDEKGNVIEVSRYEDYEGSLKSRMVLTLEPDGNRTSVTYKADGTIKYKSLTTFSAERKKMNTRIYNGKDQLLSTSVSIYDADGRRLEEAFYNPDGSLHYKDIFKYDSNNKGLGFERYDSKGNSIEIAGPASKEGQAIIIYDKRDKSITHRIYRPPTREYDSQGNWIKESSSSTTTRGDQTKEEISVTYRTITYY
ncbi:MAG: hypothetical protein WBP93_02415 [Pyrinomonadaceae bacterium]